jgi:hypothetical protein
MKIEIDVDGLLGSYASDPVVKQELTRAATLVLTAAQERDLKKTAVFGRGFDGEAVKASTELADRRNAEFEATFGRKA